MIQSIFEKISQYSRELGAIDFKIENERITNPAHRYNFQKSRIEAKIEILQELCNEALSQLK